MQFIQNILLGAFLGICTWTDLRSRQISVVIVGVFGIIGAVLYGIDRPVGILSLTGGILIGGSVLIISRWSKGGIGTGDGLVLCVTGLYLGFFKNLSLFFSALLLAAVWSVGSLLLKKVGRKTQLPFLPFMAAAYCGMLLC